MNSSGAFKWFIVVLLLPTVGWKIAALSDNQEYLERGLINFFERNDFIVTNEVVSYVPVIRASTATCQLHVARLAPDGSNRDVIRHLAGDADRSFVVFRGKVYPEQPVFWTVLNHLWSRLLRVLGLMRHIAPVIAVAANSSCNAERLPWDELQDRR